MTHGELKFYAKVLTITILVEQTNGKSMKVFALFFLLDTVINKKLHHFSFDGRSLYLL